MLKEIGIKIKNTRKNLNLSLKELEDKTGIIYVTLSRIESGKRDIKLSELKKISTALEKNVIYFLITNQELKKYVNYHKVKK